MGPDLVPIAAGWSDWVGVMVTIDSIAVSLFTNSETAAVTP